MKERKNVWTGIVAVFLTATLVAFGINHFLPWVSRASAITQSSVSANEHTSMVLASDADGGFQLQAAESAVGQSSNWSNETSFATQSIPNSLGWQESVVDDISPYGFYSSLAIDPAGNPAISYLSESGGGKLKYAHREGTSWVFQIVSDEAGYHGRYSSLAFDRLGNPAISYHNAASGNLKYAIFNGTSWEVQTVAFASNITTNTSLAFGSLGNPNIAYVYCDYPWSTKTWVRLARWNGSSWSIETVAATGYQAWSISLAIDPAGNPAISYYDSSGKNLKYAYFNGTSWEIMTVDSTANVGTGNSLAFDRLGNPAISYNDDTNGNVKYAHWNGASWIVKTVGLGAGPSLAFDSSGNPAIAYAERTPLKYALWNGTSWDIETVVDSSCREASLAFDRDGNPAISYCNWAYADSTLGYATKSVLQSVGRVVLIQPLDIDPPGPYFVGDTLEAKFTVENIGEAAITLDKLLVGGRYNGGELSGGGYPDFTYQTVSLRPGQTYEYQGAFAIPEPGEYQFFIAYYIENPTEAEKEFLDEDNWNTYIELGEGLTDADRIRDLTVNPAENEPPVADINLVHAYVSSGTSITFDGSKSYDPDGAIISYKWDFGDGTIVEGPEKSILEHRFRGAMADPEIHKTSTKDYTVRLTVEDERGATAIATAIVTVESLKKSIEVNPPPTPIPSSSFARMTAYYNWVGETILDTGQKEDVYVVSKIHFEAQGYVSYFLSVWDKYSFSIGTPTWSKSLVYFWQPVEKSFVYPFGTNRDWTYTFDDGHFEGMAVGPNDKIRLWAFNVLKISGVIGPVWDSASVSFEPSSVQEPITDEAPPDLTFIHLCSPGELRVYDSHGNITGLVSGEVKEEIPNSGYSDGIVVVLSTLDSYYYEVVGTDEGTYRLNVISAEDGEVTTFAATDISTSTGATHQYDIDWDALIQGEEGVTVMVDSDGDGVFESTFTAGNELTGDEFIAKTTPVRPVICLPLVFSNK